MKLSKPLKKKVRHDDDDGPLYKRDAEEKSSGNGGGSSNVADWAVTQGNWKRLSKEAKTEGRRAPELWVPDGQSRQVRFLDNEPIAAFYLYKMKHNGKWCSFVKPAEGQTDLFATALGMRPSRVFLYRVIDINGYTNKQGKVFKNQPRFLVASSRTFDQIVMMVEDSGGDLNEYDVKIRRLGTGTSTTYTYMPRPASPMSAECVKAAANFPKFTEFYKPLSKSQQQAIVSSHGGKVDDNEE